MMIASYILFFTKRCNFSAIYCRVPPLFEPKGALIKSLLQQDLNRPPGKASSGDVTASGQFARGTDGILVGVRLLRRGINHNSVVPENHMIWDIPPLDAFQPFSPSVPLPQCKKLSFHIIGVARILSAGVHFLPPKIDELFVVALKRQSKTTK